MVDLQGGQLGFRNLIINGDCRVNQYGNVSAVASTWKYGGCDRIQVNPSGFTTVTSGTIQQVGGSGTASGYAQAVTNLTTTGSGTVNFGQKIEALNTKHLAGKTITVSAKAYQATGSAATVEIIVHKANSADNFSAITLVGSSIVGSVPSGAYTNVSASIPVGASDAANGLWVIVRFNGIGAVTTNNFAIGDFECVVGPQSPNFEMRPIGTELALCQRYYWKPANSNVIQGWVSSATTVARVFVKFPVTMRAAPSVTPTGVITLDDQSTSYTQSSAYAADDGLSADGGRLYIGNFTGLTPYRPVNVANASNNLTFSSEL